MLVVDVTGRYTDSYESCVHVVRLQTIYFILPSSNLMISLVNVHCQQNETHSCDQDQFCQSRRKFSKNFLTDENTTSSLSMLINLGSSRRFSSWLSSTSWFLWKGKRGRGGLNHLKKEAMLSMYLSDTAVWHRWPPEAPAAAILGAGWYTHMTSCLSK